MHVLTDDISGKRFGKLTVIRYNGRETHRKNGSTLWWCRCDCGVERDVPRHRLVAKTGGTRSCGNHTKESRYRTHGRTKDPVYSVWRAMISRCTKPGHRQFADYGGRGITVCTAWITSFETFIADMGERPSGRLTLDRINNDLGYEPGNCRWTTYTVQSRNKRSSHTLTHDGLTLTIAEWAEQVGISAGTIHSRLRYGWSTERTLTTPPL